MRIRSVGSVVAVVLAGLALQPAAAAVGDCRVIRADNPGTPEIDAVSVCRQDAWIHQGVKAANLSGTAAGPAATWNTTAPTASVQQGGGSAFVSARQADVRPVLQGSFTGTLDNIAATMFLSSYQYSTLGGEYPYNLSLVVDGATLYENLTAEVRVITAPAAGDLPASSTRFAFTDVYAAMENAGLDLTSSAVHTVQLTVRGHFSDSGNVVFHFDSVEYPAGLIFNLETNKTGRVSGYSEIDTFTG